VVVVRRGSCQPPYHRVQIGTGNVFSGSGRAMFLLFSLFEFVFFSTVLCFLLFFFLYVLFLWWLCSCLVLVFGGGSGLVRTRFFSVPVVLFSSDLVLFLFFLVFLFFSGAESGGVFRFRPCTSGGVFGVFRQRYMVVVWGLAGVRSSTTCVGGFEPWW
jgi:hypothetical protein